MIPEPPAAHMEREHAHCVTCFNLRCSLPLELGVSCEVVTCPLVCGAVFHSCKSDEHQLLCPLRKVLCFNSGYGCPASLIRNQMSAHLEVCPAGVVCCTMEWNRWPFSCLNYCSYKSLSLATEDVEQLDMALALQDQRTLLESLKVSTIVPTVKKEPTVSVLKRNILTASAESEQPAISSSEIIAKGINGINEEHYSKLYQATVETARSLAAALEFVSNASSAEYVNNGAVEQEIITNSKDIQNKIPIVCNVLGTQSAELSTRSNMPGLNEQPNETGLVLEETTSVGMNNFQNVYVVQDPLQTGNQNKTSSTNVLEPLVIDGLNYRKHKRTTDGLGLGSFDRIYFRPVATRTELVDKSVDTSDLEQQEDPMGLEDIDLITASLYFCLEGSKDCGRISDSVHIDRFHVNLGTQTPTFTAVLVSNTRVGDMASASACDHAASRLSYPSSHALRLGLDLEALGVDVAAYNRCPPLNPGHQHTFACGQCFRRDQFSDHFTNVHRDIHAGLNGWMEHRCPLAYYGCSFSQRRFYPANAEAKVVHDRHLKSFGIQPCPQVEFTSAQPVQFSGLPTEILRHIAGFLDSFSLCQLSLASRATRDVCSSLLRSRGIVELRWERRRCPGSGVVSWHVKNKIWRFSTAFSPVSSWGFTNVPSMSDHLKKCPFNTVEHRTDPVPLTAMCAERDGLSLRRPLRHINIKEN